MGTFIAFLSLLIFMGVTLLGSRYFYYLYLKIFTNRTLKRLNCKLSDLKYSFEEITYLVTLPSNDPLISQAKREDLYIEKEWISLAFPTIKGNKIILRDAHKNDRLIAYLSILSFRLPILDRFLFEGKINDITRNKLCAYKLMHTQTIKELLDEVHKQLHINRYINNQ